MSSRQLNKPHLTFNFHRTNLKKKSLWLRNLRKGNDVKLGRK